MALKAITVSQLNEYISRIISKDLILNNIFIEGEISEITYHNTGNLYFSITDGYSKVRCFMGRINASTLKEVFEQGDKVKITGKLDVYKPYGTYSINVSSIEKEGFGANALAFEQLKAKLDSEGLFDPAHKKKLPFFPKRIGVVTSDTGAAIEDILKIIKSRNNVVDVVIFPCLVQGSSAPESIVSAIEAAQHQYDKKLDLLIVGRGGGSPDDLACFNDERIARAIYDCTIPVISAVGHEIDFSISDLVADRRAETPTAAAQMAVPDIAQLKRNLEDDRTRLRMALDNLMFIYQNRCQQCREKIKGAVANKLTTEKMALERYKALLESNNPLKIMGSGYAFVSDKDGKNVNSISQLAVGDEVELKVRDGFAKCKVIETGSDNYE